MTEPDLRPATEQAERVSALRALADPAPARVVYLFSVLGVADRLADGPKVADTLAAEVGADPGALTRVLRVAAGIDLVAADDTGRWSLRPSGELLRSDHSVSLHREFADNDLFTVWSGVLHSVRTGKPCYEEVFGAGLFERLDRAPEERRAFHHHMHDRARTVYGPMIDLDVWPAGATVVDVGGGTGGLLAQLLAARPDLRGVLYDFDTVLAESPLRDDPAVAGRVEFVAGDLFTAPPPKGDLHVLGSVLHDFPDEDAVRALRSCRAAVGDTGRLLVLERVLPDSGYHPAMRNDLLMLVAVGGRERTRTDWRALLAEGGFTLLDDTALPGTELSVLRCDARD